jgi:signal transduction histidine kinase
MTLVNRVSTFFLAALALCLLGYSLLSYTLIRQHLYDEFDHHLQNALNVLVAAVEVEPDSVKWQPSDHTINLGDERDSDEVRWVLVDENGQVIDRSLNLDPQAPHDRELLELASHTHDDSSEIVATSAWRCLQQRLLAPEPKPDPERDSDEFPQMIVTVARSPQPLRAELLRLAILVTLLPAALWLIAAVLGRGYCRRALQPVRDMASRARGMDAQDFNQRLPVAPQRDELTELSTAFNELLGRLEGAYEQQRRFTGDAAHQLRTPLTVLRGEIDVALRRPRTPEQYQQTLATLRAGTSDLMQIVEALLFLARTSGDAPPPHTEPVDLQVWLTTYMQRWQEHPRHADLRLDLAGPLPTTVSTSLLGVALDNLIGNALKYSEPGTPVVLHATHQGQNLCLAVIDRGAGIAPEDRTAIFLPFFRSSSARRSGTEGTGLGLAIVARIAQALGGSIACESTLHLGTSMTLTLPVVRQDLTTASAATAAPLGAPAVGRN